MHQLAPTLAVLAVAGIVWGGFACLAETDLKRLIAFSSVAHMGFVLLGVASLNPVGLQGALFANVAHGLITGLLFLVVGSLKDRYHSADLAVLGSGLRDRLPKLGWLLAFGALAGLGLPGLAGFWGEILAIAGCWQAGSQLGGLAHPLAAIAIGGTILAAAYLLRVLYLVWHGPRADLAADEAAPGEGAVSDGGWLELLLASPLVAGTFLIGLLPWLLLDLTGPAVRLLIGVSSSGVRP
jgi:NADH-quinone oxidoreductase subunit M